MEIDLFLEPASSVHSKNCSLLASFFSLEHWGLGNFKLTLYCLLLILFKFQTCSPVDLFSCGPVLLWTCTERNGQLNTWNVKKCFLWISPHLESSRDHMKTTLLRSAHSSLQLKSPETENITRSDNRSPADLVLEVRGNPPWFKALDWT